MPAQAPVLLFGQILSHLLSITDQASLTGIPPPPSGLLKLSRRNVVFRCFFPFIPFIFRRLTGKSHFLRFHPSRFSVPHWHYSSEKRSRLSGKRPRGTSLQVNTFPWLYTWISSRNWYQEHCHSCLNDLNVNKSCFDEGLDLIQFFLKIHSAAVQQFICIFAVTLILIKNINGLKKQLVSLYN